MTPEHFADVPAALAEQWKREPLRSQLAEFLRRDSAAGPRKITEPRLLRTFFGTWLRCLQVRDKRHALLFHPGLALADQQLVDDAEAQYKTRSVYWALGLTSVAYATYYFGLSHRPLFYIFTKKRPGLLLRTVRPAVKFLLLPMLIFNVNLGLIFALTRHTTEVKAKELGLFRKYHLEYIVEDKPF